MILLLINAFERTHALKAAPSPFKLYFLWRKSTGDWPLQYLVVACGGESPPLQATGIIFSVVGQRSIFNSKNDLAIGDLFWISGLPFVPAFISWHSHPFPSSLAPHWQRLSFVGTQVPVSALWEVSFSPSSSPPSPLRRLLTAHRSSIIDDPSTPSPPQCSRRPWALLGRDRCRIWWGARTAALGCWAPFSSWLPERTPGTGDRTAVVLAAGTREGLFLSSVL